MISNNRYGYYFQFKPSFYDYWIKKEFNQKKHTLIQEDISKFLKSNDYLINWNKIKINNFLIKMLNNKSVLLTGGTGSFGKKIYRNVSQKIQKNQKISYF